MDTKIALELNQRKLPKLAWRFAAVYLLALLTLAPVLAAAGTQLVSVNNPSVPPPAGGDGDSAFPSVTPDGRFVLFISSANDIAPGLNNLLRSDVFLRDRLANSNILISADMNGLGGGNSNSLPGMVSTNGRYVVFTSDASDLVPGDTNGFNDVFLRDIVAGTTTLVSVATNGVPGNGVSSYPVMTPDGRYIAFMSTASNLVANDTNGIEDVFVRDTLLGTTTLVSVGAYPYTTGAGPFVMDTPVITPDGRYVAFYSSALGLVASNAVPPGDIYLRDLIGGTTTDISSNLPHVPAGLVSTHPVISDNGRYVAFRFGYPPMASYLSKVYLYDATTQSNTLIYVSQIEPLQGTDDVYGPEMTPDGRFIAYVAADSSLHFWDNNLATDSVVSVDISNNQAAGTFTAPVFTPDGHYIAFVGTGSNLVTNTVIPGLHMYIRDLVAGTNSLVDVDTNGVGSTDLTGAVPTLSSNGRYAGFTSPDGSFVPLDNNKAFDVFLRDTVNATTELISRRDPTVNDRSGDGVSFFNSGQPSTPTGRWTVFTSRSDNLVTNDFNGSQDVFEFDSWTGSNTLISIGLDGNSAQGGDSSSPVMSVDGRYVAFVSSATNLVTTNLTNIYNNLFLRDVQAGTTTLLNVDSSNNLLGHPGISSLVLSQDGRRIAFVMSIGSQTNFIFLRDLNLGQTLLLASNFTSNPGSPPSMSADGRYIGYGSQPPGFFVWDAQLAANIYTNTTAPAGYVVLSPAGNELMFANFQSFFVVNYLSKSNLYNSSPATTLGTTGPKYQGIWSTNGRYLVYVTSTAITSPTSLDTNNANDVYLVDLVASNRTLISFNYLQPSNTANAASETPVISGDGRFVAYRSFATDIAPGITNVPNIILYDSFTGSNSLLTAGQSAPSWNNLVSFPAINANGSVVTYQSMRTGLAPAAPTSHRLPGIFSTGVSIWGATDTDGDGIPDLWTQFYFGHPTGQAGDLSRAQDDPDGDGLSNLQEYLLGTDPTKSSSSLVLNLTTITNGATVKLQWPEVPGKTYAIQYTDSLSAPVWFTAPGNITLSGSQYFFTVPINPPSRYYRVIVLN